MSQLSDYRRLCSDPLEASLRSRVGRLERALKAIESGCGNWIYNLTQHPPVLADTGGDLRCLGHFQKIAQTALSFKTGNPPPQDEAQERPVAEGSTGSTVTLKNLNIPSPIGRGR